MDGLPGGRESLHVRPRLKSGSDRLYGALASVVVTGALVSCVSAPEQDLYQPFPTDPGGLPLSPTGTLVLFVSTEAVPIESATTSRTAVAGIKDREAVVEAFAAGLQEAREDAGATIDPASIQVADAAMTAACVTGLSEPEAQSGIRQAVVDVTRPACAALLLERRVRYVALVGGAAIKSTQDESAAGMGSVLLGWDTSHAFWVSTHLLDAGTGATVCSRSQSVGASSGGTVGIILFIPMVLRQGIDAAEYWKVVAWRAGYDAGGCFLARATGGTAMLRRR